MGAKHWLTTAPLELRGVVGRAWLDFESPVFAWRGSFIPRERVLDELGWLPAPLWAHLSRCPLPAHGAVVEPRALARLWHRAALTRTQVALCGEVRGLPRTNGALYAVLQTPLGALAGLCWRCELADRWAVTVAQAAESDDLHARAERAAVIGAIEEVWRDAYL